MWDRGEKTRARKAKDWLYWLITTEAMMGENPKSLPRLICLSINLFFFNSFDAMLLCYTHYCYGAPHIGWIPDSIGCSENTMLKLKCECLCRVLRDGCVWRCAMMARFLFVWLVWSESRSAIVRKWWLRHDG